MTTITKTNERDERKQIGDALTSVESDISTLQASVTALQASVTALEAGVNGKPPTELKGIPTTRPTTTIDTAELGWYASTSASSSTFDAWTTILEETSAEGVLEFLTVHQVANTSSLDAQARLTVDGTVVWTSSTTFWSATGDNGDGVALVGSLSGGATNAIGGLGAVPFTTSFKLEFKKTENAAGTVEIGALYKYYLTG